MIKRLIFIAAALSSAASASASIGIDGILDAAYGAPTASVTYNVAAPVNNFGAPTPQSNAIGYDIWLTSDATTVYGYLKTTGAGTAVGNFANLYFDVDGGNGALADVVYEITNQVGNVGGGPFAAPAITYFAANGVIEFSMPNFYLGAHAIGDVVYLRMSQSFGYSVAGGAAYGASSLGAITIGGPVPEPASWAMMIGGLGLVGAAMRRRASAVIFA